MGLDHSEDGFVERLSRQGEETLGRLAEEIVANPVVSAAVARALEARETAVRAQEAAMGALGIPSAADVERVTRRLRSVSQRLEGIEDSLDRLESRLGATPAAEASGAAGDQLAAIAADIAALRNSLTPEGEPLARGQERLSVNDSD
jgi:hypothetical protein